MKPTNEFRWFDIYAGDLGPNHPTALHIDGTNRAMVLQQKWIETYAFSDDPVLDAKTEWRDIKLERDWQ